MVHPMREGLLASFEKTVQLADLSLVNKDNCSQNEIAQEIVALHMKLASVYLHWAWRAMQYAHAKHYPGNKLRKSKGY